eukprot:247686_1
MAQASQSELAKLAQAIEASDDADQKFEELDTKIDVVDPPKLMSIGSCLSIFDAVCDALYVANCIECATVGCIAENQSDIAVYVILLSVVYLCVSVYGFGIWWFYYFTKKSAVEVKDKIMRYENVMSVSIQCFFTIFKSVNIWTILSLTGKILSFLWNAYYLNKNNYQFKKSAIIFPILVILWTAFVLILTGFETRCDCPL